MRKLLILFLMFFGLSAKADILSNCLERVAASSGWKSGITGIFGNNDLDNDTVTAKRQQIYVLLSELIPTTCASDLVHIAKLPDERSVMYFKHKDKEYGFDFSLGQVFDGFAIQTGILVINKRNLAPNSILKLSDIPKGQKFFSDECSDWTIADNLDDDAAVNVVGQSVFGEYGGTKNEFFLDFAEGDNRRAFPGLVLMDETGSTTEKIVTYLNLKTGIEKTKQFAGQLKTTQCSNQGLSVYLVALNVSKDSTHANRWLQGGSGVVAAAGTGWAAAAGITAAAGASFLAVPVAGWIVGGALLVTSGVVYAFSMIPQTIQDIQQVAILDGPYNL